MNVATGMTRQRATELLPVIQAFARGESVQVSISFPPSDWEDYDGNCADFQNENWIWRIKPKPREWWIDEQGVARHYKEDAIRNSGKFRPIHVVEVFD